MVDQKAELTMGTSDGFNFQRPTPSDLLFKVRPYILNAAQTSKSWHYLGNEHSKCEPVYECKHRHLEEGSLMLHQFS